MKAASLTSFIFKLNLQVQNAILITKRALLVGLITVCVMQTACFERDRTETLRTLRTARKRFDAHINRNTTTDHSL
jgi:hypothetical protein